MGRYVRFCLVRVQSLHCCQTLEDMDLIFGDTEAHEEKMRIVQIEATLRGTGSFDKGVLKDTLSRLPSHQEGIV